MRKSTSLIIGLLISFYGFAQSYNSPESVEFDYANNRWLISNKSANNILERSSTTGVVSVFIPSISSPHGLEIVQDTLYICSGSTLKAYDLNTGGSIFSISLGATYLNGITHDSSYLYITDFSAKEIYRFNLETRAFSVYVTGLAKSPNGIIFDQPNNRCVFVNWGSNAPVMAFDVTTAAVSTITPTTLGSCDGIARDGNGNYYISSWSLNGISKFDNTFSTGPTTVVTGLTSPADIFYNVLTDTLGVPNSGSLNNTSYHFFGSTTAILNPEQNLLEFSVSPNPISEQAEIRYNLPSPDQIEISIYDISGKLLKVLLDEQQGSGQHRIQFDASTLPAGNYFINMSGNELFESRLIVVTQ